MEPLPLAIIDIGSNSGRVVVYRIEAEGGFRIQATTRAALRLVRGVDERHALTEEAIARTLDALRDFQAIAVGAGADRRVAVATAALRDAANAPALLERIRTELGLDVQIISGEQEAAYGFAGAVTGLPVDHGVLFDMGGGSMQLTRFRERRRLRSWSLPLGSLRLSDAFLASDPPKGAEIRRLQDHVRAALEQAGLPRLTAGESLVGTGGSVRNLAKIDRRTRDDYPIQRVHGYVITLGRLKGVVSMLADKRAKDRRSVPGLNEDRGDSIVGGSLAVLTLAETLDARELQVSSQGVREGLALATDTDGLPAAAAVRAASLRALCARFRTWDEATAARRVSVADALLRALEPGAAAEVKDALSAAALVLDIGRSVDFFDRHEHAADMVMETELYGLSHRGLALLSAILRRAGDRDSSIRRYAPLLAAEDAGAVGRAGVLLALADDIEERCPPGASLELECESGREEVRVMVPTLAGWRPRDIADRFERAFGRKLAVTAGSRPPA